MDIHKLGKLFNPKRIALIGVTSNPNSVGGKVLSNIVGSGFRGVVYPVNPDLEAALGIQCYPDIKSLPKIPDLGVICMPPEQVPRTVRECGEFGILSLIIITAGFKEAGDIGRELENKIKIEIAKFDGMRIIGPNCLGIIVPGINLNVSFADGIPEKGNIAFISQSGALCTAVLDWALKGKIGFSCFVSIGNTLDVDFGDIIDYLGEDENTKSIILYIESITNARRFMTASRAFARTKPIIAYKAGRFPKSSEVAASHTGAMISEDSVYNAAFERTGITRVYDFGDIFNCTELIGRGKIPKGPRLGIITNAGGPGVMASDSLIENEGVLAGLTEVSLEKLNESLPPYWSRGNPVDVLGDARSKRIMKAAEIVIKDKNVDALLIIITPQAMTNPINIAKSIGELAANTKKPILTAFLGGLKMSEGTNILIEKGVPVYSTPEQAVKAFMTLVRYSRNLQSLYETPKDIPVEFSIDRKKLKLKFEKISKEQGDILSEEVSKSILEAYGISVTKPYRAKSENEAVTIAEKIGYPVVLKIDSPDITHKSDAGGVFLNLSDRDAVGNAFRKIKTEALIKFPGAKIEGVTVQPMLKNPNGMEIILGIKKDPVFGTTIMAGMGGITAELMNDRSIGFPPLNERLAFRMIESLKIWPVLKGFRGKPGININKLVETLIRLSYLAADYPGISELDINPLLVTPDSVTALDARIVIDKKSVDKKIEPYSHLVLKPYPEEYVKRIKLKDATEILLRPIKPEDEPMWMDMLGSCSRESIYLRFRYFFQWASHEVAVRYCYIDYDREIAIVAEIEENNNKKLIGVGRLIADPDHETVEYAVLITDEWQNKELGSILTDYCFEISKKWGLKRILAQTTSDNKRMIAVFKRRGFEIKYDPQSTTVDVSKIID